MRFNAVLCLAGCTILVASNSLAQDPACDGIRPTSRQQFCCGGIIYYDPNFLYSCCSGRVCPVDNGNNAVIPPATQPPATTRPPSVVPVVVPAPAPIFPQPQQPQQPFWNPLANPVIPFNPPNNWGGELAIVPRVQMQTTTPPAPAIYCDGVDLTQLQKVQPSLACCGNQVVYDSRYYTCGSQQQSAQVTRAPPAAPQITLPTAFQPIVCDQNLFYIDPRIASFYKCCSSNAYDSRVETCQQAYRLLYQPTDTFRVTPLDPNVPPQRSVLTCGATKYIFASTDSAARYTC